jgi:eukaryotic-like serine/threonine-protein kinase
VKPTKRGMGAVYRARAEGSHGFSRDVAVKVLRAELAQNPQFVAHFVREAKLAGRLRHANIVSVIDVGVSDGVPWLAMDLVDGSSLSQLLHRAAPQPIPLPVASAVVIALLQALAAAHQARDETGALQPIVHRDVSPQNILVGRDGVIRLIDFGIAHSGDATRTTEIGVVKGKFGYLAPEQIEGEAAPSSDLYSAGVVLWELLAGRKLLIDAPPAVMVSQVLHRAAPLLNTVVADIPEALVEVVRRSLAKKPNERFESADAMAASLEAAVAPASSAAVRAWLEQLPPAPIPQPIAPSRHRWLTLAAVTGVALAVGVAAFIFKPSTELTLPPPAPTLTDTGFLPSTTPDSGESTLPSDAGVAAIRPPPVRAKPRIRKNDNACNPPYLIDAQGIRRYKVECL